MRKKRKKHIELPLSVLIGRLIASQTGPLVTTEAALGSFAPGPRPIDTSEAVVSWVQRSPRGGETTGSSGGSGAPVLGTLRV